MPVHVEFGPVRLISPAKVDRFRADRPTIGSDMQSFVRTHPTRIALGIALVVVACTRSSEQAADPPEDILTFQYAPSRTGASLHETALNPQTVRQDTFGKRASFPVDGYVYAQPLYVAQLTIAGTQHEVLYVATQHDSVYAFDATGASTKPLWRVSVLGNAETPVPAEETLSADIVPEVGITSTPVIDRAAGLLYTVAKSKRADGTYVQRLHALRLVDGSEGPNSPVDINAKVPSTNDEEAPDGMLAFEPLHHNQRAALALIDGHVWIAWASHGDMVPYHGWVMAYDTADLTKPPAAFSTTPNGSAGGIWMGASGPSTDGEGNVYVASGNGFFDDDGDEPKHTNYGSSALKLRLENNQIKLVDYFSPHDEKMLSNTDQDFGTSGVLILPDQPGPIPHRIAVTSKSGMLYVLNRDDLGGFDIATDHVVQSLFLGSLFFISNPVFFNNSLYVCLHKGTVMQFPYDPVSGMFSTDAFFAPDCANCFQRGARPTISANGDQGAIVWLSDNTSFDPPGPAILRAYDATNVAALLYDSSVTPGGRDASGAAVKFTAPVVSNGRVYVAGQSSVTMYGLLSP